MPCDEIDALFDEVIEGWAKDNPISATYIGIHHYDHLLGNIDEESRRYRRKKDERFYNRLKEFENDKTLTHNQKIDMKLLKNDFETTFYYHDKLRPYERSPSIAPGMAMGGLHIFMVRDFAPANVKLENMLSRLSRVPQLIAEGKANMLVKREDIPPIWVNTAMEEIEGGGALFLQAIPNYAKNAKHIFAEMGEACAKANESLQGYREFLKNEILPKAQGDYAIGKEKYEYFLKNVYQLSYGAEELKKIGEDIIIQTEKELESMASEIMPGKRWKEVTASLKGNYPEKDRLIEFYNEEISKLRKFIIKEGIVDIPEGESLSIIETPPFSRTTIPYAAYMSPAPFESMQVGCFYVTPVNKDYPQKQQEEQLEGHNRYKAVYTALHEGYPGHHLQLVYANRVQSRIRKLFGDTVFVEGWALYCEELMRDVGYITDPRCAIFQLKDQLWRACRVVIDVGLHTGGMTFDQAVDMLVNVVQLEKINAVAEVKRYTESPTQPMSYTIGKMLIKELKEDYRKKVGAQYSLKGFHNQLLSYGSLPVKIIRDEMLN